MLRTVTPRGKATFKPMGYAGQVGGGLSTSGSCPGSQRYEACSPSNEVSGSLPLPVQPYGSVTSQLWYTEKCRCGPDELPVEPLMPISSPARTTSPLLTA